MPEMLLSVFAKQICHAKKCQPAPVWARYAMHFQIGLSMFTPCVCGVRMNVTVHNIRRQSRPAQPKPCNRTPQRLNATAMFPV